jgi:predicted Zn-dependent peptidase
MSGATRLVAERPEPGQPRRYEFPATVRTALPNGLRVVVTPMPGRGLGAASLVLRGGAAEEPESLGGATVLAARGLTEGTELRDAIALVEAAERLGASLHAEAGWDATSAGVDVPVSRLEPALALLAEIVRWPAFPDAEIERLRDERLTDLLQARADPRRRADEAFADAIYAPSSPYRRPAGGTAETVGELTAGALRDLHARAASPSRAALVVAGDVDPDAVVAMAASLFGDWAPAPGAGPGAPGNPGPAVDDSPARDGRLVRVVHRPGAVQTEIRIGHAGLSRRHPDFHAVSVMSAILGGLFNSRLNMNLREEKGYTYGAGAGFDLRRGRGPFSARAAVNTEVTVPAVGEILAELDRIRETPVADPELRAARDYLVGVFPLRFETPGPVVGSLAGLFVHDLPDDELATYRARIEAVTTDDVLRVARDHIRPEAAAVILVGDHDAFAGPLDAAALGPLDVVRDPAPAPAASAADETAEPGPVGDGEAPGRDDDGEGAGHDD